MRIRPKGWTEADHSGWGNDDLYKRVDALTAKIVVHPNLDRTAEKEFATMQKRIANSDASMFEIWNMVLSFFEKLQVDK